MSDRGGWYPSDEVGAALRSAVDDYSVRSLSSPQVLGNLLSDLLPDAPREQSLLLQAAEVDVAGTLTRHLDAHMDLDTAVRLTAASLADARPLSSDACLWVTGQFARALGHPVALPAGPVQLAAPSSSGLPGAPPGVVSPPPPPPGVGSTPTINQPGAPSWSPPPAPGWTPPPAAGGAPAWGAPQAPAPGWPPATPPPAGGGRSKAPKTILILVAGLVGALIVYLVVAAAASIAPFEKKATVAVPPSSSTSTLTTTPSTTAPSTTAPAADQAAFLQSIHTQPHFDGLSDSDLTTLGNDVCQDFATGDTLDETKQDALKAIAEINANDAESGNNPGGSLTPYDAGYLIGASVRNLCPEYLSQINP